MPELVGGIQRLEHAIGSPAGDPAWQPGMARALTVLRSAFADHVAVTEGPAGLYADVVEHSPRLARGVSDLLWEHRIVWSALDALEGSLCGSDVGPDIQRHAARLLRGLWQHRQRGADLLYEAYTCDIGGET
jgi:hypothetical protein